MLLYHTPPQACVPTNIGMLLSPFRTSIYSTNCVQERGVYSPGILQMGKINSNEAEIGIFLHQKVITGNTSFQGLKGIFEKVMNTPEFLHSSES